MRKTSEFSLWPPNTSTNATPNLWRKILRQKQKRTERARQTDRQAEERGKIGLH